METSTETRVHGSDARRASLSDAECRAAALLTSLPANRRHDPRPRPDLPVFSRIPLGPFVVPVRKTAAHAKLQELCLRARDASWGERAGEEPDGRPFTLSYLYRHRGRTLAAIRLSLRAPTLGALELPEIASLGVDPAAAFGSDAAVIEASPILVDPERLVHVGDAIAFLLRAVLANLEYHAADFLVLPVPIERLPLLRESLGLRAMETDAATDVALAVGRAEELRGRLLDSLPAALPTPTEVIGLSI